MEEQNEVQPSYAHVPEDVLRLLRLCIGEFVANSKSAEGERSARLAVINLEYHPLLPVNEFERMVLSENIWYYISYTPDFIELSDCFSDEGYTFQKFKFYYEPNGYKEEIGDMLEFESILLFAVENGQMDHSRGEWTAIKAKEHTTMESSSLKKTLPKKRAIGKKVRPPRKSITKNAKVNALTNEEALSLVASVFEKIRQARTIKDLEEIEGGLTTRFPDDKLPKLSFGISPAEVSDLCASGIINTEGNIDMETLSSASAVVRLLFATLWKRGDAQKIRHIVHGILSATEKEKKEEKDALVFHQFGRHLANRMEEPIIDQHTMRAYLLFLYPDREDNFITKVRGKQTFNEYGEEFKSYRSGLKQGLLLN